MKRYVILILVGLFVSATNICSQSALDKNLEGRILKAVEKFNAGEYEVAKKMLTSVLLADESYDAAWYYQAMIAIMNGDADLAKENLQRAIELDPDNFWYRYRLAALYSYSSQGEVAIDMYERLLEDFPKKSDLYLEMVELYTDQGNYDKALEVIGEIENVFGQSETLVLTESRLLHLLGREEESMDCLRQYNSKFSSPYILCILAEDEMTQYNDSTALAFYDEALDLDPSFPLALLGKAEVCRMTYRYDEYFPVIKKYMESHDESSVKKADYLLALIEKGDPNFLQQYRPMMDEIINKYIEVHSKEERSYEVGGLYYFYTHRFDEAKKFFYGYVEEYPEDQSASVALVECLMYLECWEELSQEGRKAYARFPEEYTFLELAAIGDYHLGNYDKVLEVCSELLSLVDDEAKAAGILATAGDAYYNLNDKKNAYKAYDAVLKMDPDNLYVLNNYAYYLCLDGRNLKKAYEMSRKTIEAEPDNVTYMDTFGWILYLQGKYIEARPIFKNAMLHGGKESAVILDHYAEVLYALGEYDMAFIYWNLAMQKDTADVPGLREKVDARRQEVKK